MNLELVAKLIKILPEQTGQGANGPWRKVEFVVETQDQYPKKVCMSLWGNRADELKKVQVGQNIRTYFNVESREYEGRWFTNAQAWRIDNAEGGQAVSPQGVTQATTPQNQPVAAANTQPAEELNASNQEEDLPF